MIVINFFAGPGAGKSTLAAGLFYNLKLRGINAELALEFAKDLTWEKRFEALGMQQYVFGEQYYRLKRLEGKVDVVVTDSPLLLSRVYRPEKLTEGFVDMVGDSVNEFHNVNFVVERSKTYLAAGRNQTEREARDLDDRILAALRDFYGFNPKARGGTWMTVPGNEEGLKIVLPQVFSVLGLQLQAA